MSTKRDEDEDLLTREDIVREFRVSPATVSRCQKRGELTALKRRGDRKHYFRRSEVDEAMRLQPKKDSK